MSSGDKMPNASWNQQAQRTEQTCRRAGKTGERGEGGMKEERME